MPQFYKPKTHRSTRTTQELLRLAAEEKEKGTSLRKAGEMFDIDKMTLKRYIDKTKANGSEAKMGYSSVSLAHSIFSPTMEEDLAKHIAHLADQYYGLSLDKCKELAYEFAISNGLNVPDSWISTKKAGRSWWTGFKNRQNLSLRKPEATSLGRASAFNKHNANLYFNNLSTVLEKYKFEGRQIYNLDETGVTTVQDPDKVVTVKGTRRVSSATSAERGELVTAAYAVCANGSVIPPMLIFPRKNYHDHFIRGGPEGCIGKAAPTGWMNEKLFVEYLEEHFAKHTQCSPQNMVLLILDNHASHVSLAAIDKCRELGIVLLTIPPKTSHRLQPLDTAIFGPFKNAYNKAIDAWIRSNPGKRVTIYDIPMLIREAQLNSITPRNVLSGFSSTGNWPFNPEVFTDLDFASSSVTDRDLIPAENDEHPDSQCDMMDNSVHDSEALNAPSSSTTPTAAVATPASYVSPTHILPLPKAPARKTSGPSRRKGKSAIYTLTPTRNEIAEREKNKAQKKTTKRVGLSKKPVAKKQLFQKKKSKKPPKKIVEESSDEETVSIHYDDESDLSLSDEEVAVADVVGKYVIVKVG